MESGKWNFQFSLSMTPLYWTLKGYSHAHVLTFNLTNQYFLLWVLTNFKYAVIKN